MRPQKSQESAERPAGKGGALCNQARWSRRFFFPRFVFPRTLGMRSHPLLPGLLCLQTGRMKPAVWVARCPRRRGGSVPAHPGVPLTQPRWSHGSGPPPPAWVPNGSHRTGLAGLVSDQVFFVIVSSNCLLMVSIFVGIPSAVPDPGSESHVSWFPLSAVERSRRSFPRLGTGFCSSGLNSICC